MSEEVNKTAIVKEEEEERNNDNMTSNIPSKELSEDSICETSIRLLRLRTILEESKAAGIGSISGLMVVVFSYLNKDHTTLGELSIELGVSTSAITGLVDNLSRLGLGERTMNPMDRRKLKFVLNDRGREVAVKVIKNLSSCNCHDKN